MSKKTITVSESAREQLTDYSSLKSVRDAVNRLIREYGEGAGIEFDSGYNNISELITYTREETDQEYQKRLKDEARQRSEAQTKKERQDEKDRKEYERLKAKFG